MITYFIGVWTRALNEPLESNSMYNSSNFVCISIFAKIKHKQTFPIDVLDNIIHGLHQLQIPSNSSSNPQTRVKFVAAKTNFGRRNLNCKSINAPVCSFNHLKMPYVCGRFNRFSPKSKRDKKHLIESISHMSDVFVRQRNAASKNLFRQINFALSNVKNYFPRDVIAKKKWKGNWGKISERLNDKCFVRFDLRDAIALLIRNVSINTLNSNWLIRNTWSESIVEQNWMEVCL